MKKLLCLITFIPLLIYAQEKSKGIQFEEGLTWDQIQAKAKSENKYIFVDCYATWCVPCKEMDRNVYPKEEVGAVMNDQFISVKVQMDITKKDRDNVKLLYAAARELEKQYKIDGLPTFLFFSPHGKAVHKDMGSKSAADFIELLKDAQNPDKQLYTLIHSWQSGKMNYAAMPALAAKLSEFKEDSLALEVAKAYMHGYMDKLSDEEFCKKENLDFFRSYARMVSSNDRIFKLYYQQPVKVDQIMSLNGYSKSRVNGVIKKEEIQPAINKAKKRGKIPDWKKIYTTIKKKYNRDYAEDNVLFAKKEWYNNQKDWNNYTFTLMKLWEYKGVDIAEYGWIFLNDMAWTVCVHRTNKNELNTALDWSNLGIGLTEKPEPPILDTKANILYKLGKREEAVAIMNQILEIYTDQFENEKDEKQKEFISEAYITPIRKIIDKMEKGEAIQLSD